MSALERWCRSHPDAAGVASHLCALAFGLVSGVIFGAAWAVSP